MPDVVEENEPFHPLAVGAFGPRAVVAGAKGLFKLIQKFRRPFVFGWVSGKSFVRISIVRDRRLFAIEPRFIGWQNTVITLVKFRGHC
jgi:hypothetical protein